MFSNSMSLVTYFELRFTPKRRTKKNFVVCISGPLKVSKSFPCESYRISQDFDRDHSDSQEMIESQIMIVFTNGELIFDPGKKSFFNIFSEKTNFSQFRFFGRVVLESYWPNLLYFYGAFYVILEHDSPSPVHSLSLLFHKENHTGSEWHEGE